jgi:hypothetical protein
MLTGGGIQNKLLEAMAMGCRTINTTHTIRALVNVRRGIHLLVADTPTDFASIIRSIDVNPSRYDHLGPAAREYIRANFTWTRSGEIYSDAIERTIETHKLCAASAPARQELERLHGREPVVPNALFHTRIMDGDCGSGLENSQ